METKPEYTTKAVVPYQPLTPATWQMILGIAETVHKARLFGTGSVEQAAAIMLKGHELGLPLTASFEFIYAITVGGKTRASLSPRGHLALIQQSPLCALLNIKDQVDTQGNPSACTVTMKRTNGFSYTVTVTMDDARRAGLVKPGSGWENWPANMLRWRATGFCADVVFGDLGGGMKRTDELGANVDQAGDVIEGVIDADPWEVVVKAPEPEQPKIDMDYLLDHWTTDQIMKTTQQILGTDTPTVPGKDDFATIAAELERLDTEKLGGVV